MEHADIDMQQYAHLYEGLRDGTINRDHYTLQDLQDVCSLFSVSVSFVMPDDHENRDQATFQDALNGVFLNAARELSDGVFEEKPDASLEEWGMLLHRMSDVFRERCLQYTEHASDAALDFAMRRHWLDATVKMDVDAQERGLHRRFGPKSKR